MLKHSAKTKNNTNTRQTDLKSGVNFVKNFLQTIEVERYLYGGDILHRFVEIYF